MSLSGFFFFLVDVILSSKLSAQELQGLSECQMKRECAKRLPPHCGSLER